MQLAQYDHGEKQGEKQDRLLTGHAGPEKTGAARGIRTPDPLITNEVLYQLSYCGILVCAGGPPRARPHSEGSIAWQGAGALFQEKRRPVSSFSSASGPGSSGTAGMG